MMDNVDMNLSMMNQSMVQNNEAPVDPRKVRQSMMIHRTVTMHHNVE